MLRIGQTLITAIGRCRRSDAADQQQRRDRQSAKAKRRADRLGRARTSAGLDGRSGTNRSSAASRRGQTVY